MGCDIHMFAEKKKNGKWKQMREEFRQDAWGGDGKYYSDHPYEGRNYELFALLADVRNRDGIKPFSEPKGIPEDASDSYREIVEDWSCDGHSHSFFTLAELIKFNSSELSAQEVFDTSVIISKDNEGNTTSTAAWTNAEHHGQVGSRKLFSTFKDEKNPIDTIIEQFKYEEDMNNVRVVFFFDN